MKSTQLRNTVLLTLVVVALASSLRALWPWPTGDWKGLALNSGTEMGGAAVTYLLLGLFIGRRQRREAERADLIAQMGSIERSLAIGAVEELRRHGWLTDGSLRGADLTGANLQGADLTETNLQGIDLRLADLRGADLSGANLQGADLRLAKLQDAILADADLRGADLRWAKLQGASLYRADLQGAAFDEHTTSPDGTAWTPGTDMARFTNPDHPDFWSPLFAR
ncbi:MAG: pentapeptide repeat-containing protein [Anaerolineae bacterium]